MKYLKFTYVDAQTGPKFPPVVGLSFVWARESAYPTDVPQFFGTCPDDSDTQIDGVLGIFNQADWEQMQADEMERRPNSATSLRAERDKRLAACDWTQVADAPVVQVAWAAYRQALRDVPAQAGFPLTVEWPSKPE